MKISVLIIAHNEEKYIAKCLESILHQTKHPDEIVLLAHNCTDKTIEIAKTFPITLVPFDGERGIINARLQGLNNVSGDMILCIDGDAFAKNNWVEVMTETLNSNNNSLVGSWVKLKGSVFSSVYNLFSMNAHFLKNQKLAYWIWASSYAFWGKDKNFIQEIIKKSASLSAKLNLPRNPDDYWVSLFMGKRGNLQVTNKTHITAYSKDTSSIEELKRRIESRKNRILMRNYFNKNFNQ